MATQAKRRPASTWLVPALVVTLVVVLILLAMALSNDQKDTTPTPPPADNGNGAPTEVQGPSDDRFLAAERRDESDPLAIGSVDAPIVLVVFSDYQCRFCAQWTEQTLPAMMDYVEAGDMRIEWRDVNVFGEDSERGARAAYAAGLQGAFWEYHEELFQRGSHSSGSILTDDALVVLASELGLDPDQFAVDLASPEVAVHVDENASLGRGLGAHSTPSFLIGGEPVVGAQPTQVFVDAVERALTTAR